MASWLHFGAPLGLLLDALGALLGAFLAPWGSLGALLGAFLAPLGSLGALLGAFLALWGSPWAFFGSLEAPIPPFVINLS